MKVTVSLAATTPVLVNVTRLNNLLPSDLNTPISVTPEDGICEPKKSTFHIKVEPTTVGVIDVFSATKLSKLVCDAAVASAPSPILIVV